MRLQRSLIAGLAAAGALGVGLLLSPATQAAQDAKPAMITISGTAVNPDGAPGANLAVALKAPEKKPAAGDSPGGGPGLLAQEGTKQPPKAEGAMKTLAKGTTDAQGKFALKFQPPAGGPSELPLFLEIGDSTRGPWAKHPVLFKGKDMDLGNITLKAAAAK